MASANLRQELDCSICLTIYTDPVNLMCGHNYCRDCINRVLDTQEESGGYFCPECREEFQDRPVLHRNITLRNIVETFRSTQPDEESEMCAVYNKSPEHVLSDPTTSMERRKCSVHKKLLEYYCTKDSICICVSCRLDGDHQGHKVETLDEASERKKQELRNVLKKLITQREKTEKRLQSLQEHRQRSKECIADKRKSLSSLFRDLRRQLEDLEKRVLSDITRQEENLSLSLSALIKQLEIKKEDLSRKMGDIEKLCNMTDPLTVLQESDTGDLCDTEKGDNEDTERHDNLLHNGGDLDVVEISHALHTLLDMIKGVNVCFNIQGASDMVLDVNTAHNILHISDDMKTVSRSHIYQNRPVTPMRFQYCAQVLSRQRFSSGRHYWDVDVSKSECWGVGMCYPSIERRGEQSVIGDNSKSWCVYRNKNIFVVKYNRQSIQITGNIPKSVRVYLDYEAGQLSFYNLSDPIRHLHTFTTTFTEPLHAGLYVTSGHITISGGGQRM